jgi:hypothetical protein
MTVADNTSRNQYTATSGQTVFAYTFEIVDKDDIVVLKNGTTLSEGTDYTVSNVGNDSGGNVTLTVGATAGDILTLYRDMPYARTQNYTNSGDFLASEVNSDFDNLWLAGEQTNRSFSQSIRKPITDSDSISMELPEAASRANKYLTFDSTGAVSTQGASAVTTLTRQNFTGDGSTTAFTLSTAPESTGGNLQVYIDGVHQENSAYSVSGSVVTFTAAPPINSAIEVVAFATGSIGSTTADLVTYIPAGTGAVQTTVQTKLRESVSVKDFGAVGDGVTDDTAAIQAAIDYALTTGGICYIPAGVFAIASTIKIGSGINLYGQAGHLSSTSVLRYTGTGDAINSKNNAVRQLHGTIQNLCIEATSTSNTGIGLNLETFGFLRVNDVTVRGFASGGGFATGVKISSASGLLGIDSCIYRNVQVLYCGNGFDITGVSGSQVADCILDTCGVNFMQNPNGTANASAVAFKLTTFTDRVILSNCYYKQDGSFAMSSAIKIGGSFTTLIACGGEVNQSVDELLIDATAVGTTVLNHNFQDRTRFTNNAESSRNFITGHSQPLTIQRGSLDSYDILDVRKNNVSLLNIDGNGTAVWGDSSGNNVTVDDLYISADRASVGEININGTAPDSLGNIHLVMGKAAKRGFTIHGVTSQSDRYVHVQDSAGTAKFAITAAGTTLVDGGAVGNISSDRRLKENIVDANDALSDINGIRVVNFNMIGRDKKEIGVIAQEFESIFPSLVQEEYDENLGGDYKTVIWGPLIWKLTKALQEADQKIETLKAEITQIKEDL